MNIDLSPVSLVYGNKGALSQEDYNGVFKIRPKLSPIEVLECDRDRRDLLGNPKNDEQVGADAVNLAICLSQLKIRIVEGPSWWSSTFGLRIDFHDENIIFDLFKQVVEIESKWKENLKKTAEEAKAKFLKPNG